EGFALLGALLSAASPQVAALRMRFGRYLTHRRPVPAFLEALSPRAGGRSEETPDNARTRILSAPPGERRSRLEQYLRLEVAKVLGTYSAASIDPGKGFQAMGMDSLLSLQLRNRLQTGLASGLPATPTRAYPSRRARAH